ncbi:MAG TPA: GNAT family N-acetyltransferase [Burkholderiaceae bacterium]|nr:GNAT family N-acetyltransferase [Burkholderiaceae bacterium]
MRAEDLGLGWRSHLLACRFDGDILERDDCIVVRSPSNPTYYWGNCLILRSPPCDGDLGHWLQRFDEEIARRQPASKHLAFGIDAERLDDALPAWRAAGIDEFDAMAVLTLAPDGLAPTPAVRNASGLVLRALDLPRELDLAVEAQVAARDASFEAAGYRVFRASAMRRVAAMQAAGVARWFGAVVGDDLAADCGLVHDGAMGRFQYVETQAAWRRRGLCRALVHHVCRHAFDTLGLQMLVMCADPHDVAIDIYRSVGFAQVETHWCLQRRPSRE